MGTAKGTEHGQRKVQTENMDHIISGAAMQNITPSALLLVQGMSKAGLLEFLFRADLSDPSTQRALLREMPGLHSRRASQEKKAPARARTDRIDRIVTGALDERIHPGARAEVGDRPPIVGVNLDIRAAAPSRPVKDLGLKMLTKELKIDQHVLGSSKYYQPPPAQPI